ncbi:MAG: D-tyrosyl-tRNA(Tyr) deacylase [Oscillospiraceae bacterium]|nr:D-tyrosyl-tRNA(Tyr) deacylase [Oscillospiraceae bacterium]
MKTVIQRVNRASVTVEGEVKGSIGKGFLILFGAEPADTDEDCSKLAEKISKLRIFEDENGKTNLSIKDVGGDILSVSQFTLLADCSHGNRPSFIGAAKPDEANRLYEKFNSELRARGLRVETGVFGAHMVVDLENDGPFTIVL